MLLVRKLHYFCKEFHFSFICSSFYLDVALVTSLRDGMNLVSYEFVACQASKKGVLILSEVIQFFNVLICLFWLPLFYFLIVHCSSYLRKKHFLFY